MKDSNTVSDRISSVRKRKKICFFLGWPLIALGMALLFSGHLKPVAVGLLVVGVILRLLYYLASSELRSLEKYGHLMDNGKNLILVGFILFAVNGSLSAQLKRGDSAVNLSGIEFLDGSSFAFPEEDSEKAPLTVIEFWAPWDKASQLSFPLLMKLKKKYPEDKIVFLAITKEKQDAVQEFLDNTPQKPNFRIGIDSEGEITKKYIGDIGGFPQIFIVDKSHRILWNGNPLDLEMVLEDLFKGTFDPDLQEKITTLHKKLQGNMQLERIPAAISTIEEIMKLDPADTLAMRVRLYLFERSQKLPDAIPFVEQLIEKSPETSSLYFVKLDIMNRVGKSPDEIRAFSKVIFDKFNSSPDVLEHIAWSAAFRMPIGRAPLEIALDSIEKAVAMLLESKENTPVKMADYLETEARIYYMIGKLAKALELQERVVVLRKGDDNEHKSAIIADYYKTALRLNNR